ncbi:MAG: SH3 domain-containing protein [Chloroflexi bacterium]|nr:SH3 domain-containing protein [Chloroflexota bacterium]
MMRRDARSRLQRVAPAWLIREPAGALFVGLLVSSVVLFVLGAWLTLRELGGSAASVPTPAIVQSTSSTATPTPTSTVADVVLIDKRPPTRTPTLTITPRPSVTPTETETPVPTPPPPTATLEPSTRTPTPTATLTPTLTATPPSPTATPTRGRFGTTRAAYGGGVAVRAQPSSQSPAVESIPVGTRVQLLDLVVGEAIDPVEPRWYLVQFSRGRGYVYYKLIAPD